LSNKKIIIIKDEVLLTVSCPIFSSILTAKNLLTGSLKNRPMDNLEEIESPIFFFLFFLGVYFLRQNYYASLEKVFDVLTLFNVKITVKTKYQMSIDYSTSFWVNYSEHTTLHSNTPMNGY
jgi:hypothetical protein